MDITLLICALFLFILAILLYIGKLSNMIAGYNTLSAKEKEQYEALLTNRRCLGKTKMKKKLENYLKDFKNSI